MRILTLILMLLTSAIQAQQAPSFELAPDAKRKLVEKAATLKAGDSFQAVSSALGTPNQDQRILQDENGVRIPLRLLKFDVTVWDKPNAWRNESILVKLDGADRVRSVRINVTLE